MTEVNISREKLVKYLKTAEQQRRRAATKFVDDYGPNSSVVMEISAELAELGAAINTLMAQPDTPLERHLAATQGQKKGA
jgi:hypothetical protein